MFIALGNPKEKFPSKTFQNLDFIILIDFCFPIHTTPAIQYRMWLRGRVLEKGWQWQWNQGLQYDTPAWTHYLRHGSSRS